MKAVKYKVKVIRSVLEWSHGMEWSIEEIFIPEKEIIFNLAAGDLQVFKSESERSNEGKEEIEVDACMRLDEYAERKFKGNRSAAANYL